MQEMDYLRKCLALIEQKLNWGSRDTWTFQDFRKLQELLFEASSISLSVHTLERLFGKLKIHKNYNPQPDTKNALAIFLGYQDWIHFKEANRIPTGELASKQASDEELLPVPIGTEAIVNSPSSFGEVTRVDSRLSGRQAVTTSAKGNLRKKLLLLLVVLSAGCALYIYLRAGEASPEVVKGQLEAFPPYGRKPHTVKFSYHVTGAPADNLYLEFEGTQWKLPAEEKPFFNSYMRPGIFDVKLKAGAKTLATTNVFIDTEGWEGYLYRIYEQPQTRKRLPKELLQSGGLLHTNPNQLGDTLTDKMYFVEYNRVKNFGVDGDNLQFDVRFRSNESGGGQLCNDMWFKLSGTKGILKMHFLASNCFAFVQMVFGNTQLDGHTQDLSVFAQEISDWKQARMVVNNKRVFIYFEDQLIYQTTYQQPVGSILGISVTSKGSGETDYVKLYNAQKQLVFSDSFDGP